jgi:Flp pilus assembly pilin Flp
MINLLYKFSWDESGISAVEYAILVAFLSVLVFTSVQYFYTALRDLFIRVANDLPK